MGGGITSEDAREIQESLQRSNCLHRVLRFPLEVINFCIDSVLYGPGIGKISTEKVIKNKICKVETTKGPVNLPLMKMICFDLTCGFITKRNNFQEGIGKYSDFIGIQGTFPRNIPLKTVETYWIVDYRRPKDINGLSEAYFYILSELEDLIYIEKISNNDLIDYEKMVNNYEIELEKLELIENEIVNVTQPVDLCFNENCTTVKKKDL